MPEQIKVNKDRAYTHEEIGNHTVNGVSKIITF